MTSNNSLRVRLLFEKIFVDYMKWFMIWLIMSIRKI